MCGKSIYLISFVLVLCVTAGVANAHLVAYWPMDEGSGTTVGDATGTWDGTITGNVTWVDGKDGMALEFPGGQNYVNFGNVEISPDLSLAYWCFNPAKAYERPIGQHSGDYTTDPGWCVFSRNEAEGTVWFRVHGADNAWNGGDIIIPDILSNTEWYHLTFTFDGTTRELKGYLNGELKVSNICEEGRSISPSTNDLRMGNVGTAEPFAGMLDEVAIWNHVLTEDEILAVMEGHMGGANPNAFSPDPGDGALHSDTWVTLSWKPGAYTVSHDIYMGDNFDDVNNATRDSDVFRGSQPLGTDFYIAGFFGYAYPEGLVNGTTYYWRIDEVNDAEPNSPWKGDVWSFTVPPKTAYDPIPASGAKFINAEGSILSWTAGFGSKLHYIYFGDDYDTVANAAGASPSAFTTYNPGPLETEKTYYWRVDESDGTNTFTGDVWSFTTAKAGGGIRADYYNGMNFDNLMVTRIEEQINFNWGDPGGPDPVVGDDQFSARWTGEVQAAFTETYTFYTNSDDGVRLWIDGQLLIENWTDHAPTENSGTIDLVAGDSYSLVMEFYENGGGATAELRWSSPSTPKQLIPQAALSPPIKASSPSPPNGATGTKMTPILKWGAGDYAASHEVYFGTDANAVANADKSSPEYKGTKALGDESYDPGKLAWFTTYYWRIDEVNNLNPDSPWVGNVWSFTTGDFIVVDDFEDYDVDKPIWEYWLDGVGFGTPGSPDYFAGNGTGAAVGDESSPSYMEETIVHSGNKSIPVDYNNNKQGSAKYSETELTLTVPRDWTEEDVKELSIWFMGYPVSVGSFVEGPIGTYTMTGSGTDIWDDADEFHFAYKMLTGAGSIVARVESVQETNTWAKAGVMIRESLEPGSVHAMMVVTPAQGISFQRRTETDSASAHNTTGEITAPYWVKIERDLAGNFTAYSSTNGTTWEMQGLPENIQMSTNVYIGLALTSHDAGLACQAVFSNVTTAGNVTGQWTNQDIGIESNEAEPLYVAVSNSAGQSAVVINDDPAAATIDTWTEWVIPLSAFADQGIDLTDIDRIAIGLGTQGNMTIPGGSGKMYFDDIRLYRLREVAE